MPAIDDFIIVTEVDHGPAFVAHIFERKYRAAAPAFGHHIVAFYRQSWDRYVPFSYVHFTNCGDIYLAGGASTDGRAFALMDEDQRHTLTAAGGAYVLALRYGFQRFAARCEAIYGYCGDARAWEGGLQAGFAPSGEDKLLIHVRSPLDALRERELTAKALSFIPF
jgi:hypothetical protein